MIPPRSHLSKRIPSPLKNVGRFRVLSLVDQDDVGTTNLARLEEPSGDPRWVTLRIIHPEIARNADFKRRFFAAARVGAGVVHPNMTATLDAGETDGLLWLASEYLHGERLADLLERERVYRAPLPWDVACRVAGDLAQGLDALHEAHAETGERLGIVHGRFAPCHAVLTYDGTSKVLGPPIDPPDVRRLDIFELPYAAPEVARRDPPDVRADLHAIGVILWELVSGQRLFGGGDERATVQRVVAHVVPRLRPLALGCPASVDKIIAKATAPDPGRRFSSGRELADALNAALAAEARVVTDDDVGQRVRALFRDTHEEREDRLRSAADVTEVLRRAPLAAPLTAPLAARTAARELPDFTDEDDAAETLIDRRLPAETVRLLPQVAPPRLLAPPHSLPPPPPFSSPPFSSPPPPLRPTPPPPPPSPPSPDLADLPPTLQRVYAPPPPLTGTLPPPRAQYSATPLAPPPTPVAGESVAPPRRPRVLSVVIVLGTAVVVGVTAAGLLQSRMATDPVAATIGAAPTSAPAPLSATAPTADPPASDPSSPPSSPAEPTSTSTPNSIQTSIQTSTQTSTHPPIPTPTTISPPAAPPTQRPDVPASPPSPSNRPPANASREMGLLTVVCIPACDQVYDGKTLLGPSPVFKAPVAAGQHRLRLRILNPPSSKTVDVVVLDDETTVVRETMD